MKNESKLCSSTSLRSFKKEFRYPLVTQKKTPRLRASALKKKEQVSAWH